MTARVSRRLLSIFKTAVVRHLRQLTFVFDDPNILLEFHVDHVYTLQDIAIFIFSRFAIACSLPFIASFWGYYPNEFRYCHNPQKDRP